MKKFSIKINGLIIHYNHYLSDNYIKYLRKENEFKERYPLWYNSRKFDKPGEKWKNGCFAWRLDSKLHRTGRPAMIYNNGRVEYYENGEWIK